MTLSAALGTLMVAGGTLVGLNDVATVLPLSDSPSWYFPDQAVTDKDSGTFRVQRTAKVAQKDLRPCFAGFNASADFANAHTIAACYIEYSGVAYQVTFNGSGSVVVNPGDWVQADVVAGLPALAAGDVYYVRTHQTVTLGQQLYLGQIANSYARNEASNIGVSATNRANGTGTTNLPTTSGYTFGPTTVIATPTGTAPPLVAGKGDSITHGTSNEGGWADDDALTIYQVGFGDQAAHTAGAAYMNLGLYGEVIPESPFAGDARRDSLLALYPPDAIVVNYGVNNVRSGTRTLLEITTDWDAYVAHLVAAFPGANIIACTLTPETTSGDGWTSATQTPAANETLRTQVNAHIRASTVPMTVLDTADGTETARDSGIWITAGGTPTVDGLHPNAVGGELMAAQMARQGYYSLIRHSGAATAPLAVTGLLASATSATEVSLSWDVPNVGGKALTDYAIRYRIVGAGSWTTFSHTASTFRTATITGLTTGETYEFQVAGVNSVGTGTYSASSTATPSSAGDITTGLYRMYDASVVSGSDNDPQASVASIGSDTTAMTQAASASRPLLRTAFQNGRNVFEINPDYNPTPKWFDLPSLTSLTSATVAIVVKAVEDPASNSFHGQLWTTSSPDFEGFYPYTDGNIYEAFGTTARKTVGNPSDPLDEWNVYVVTTASADWAAYLNGTQLLHTGTNTVSLIAAPTLGKSSIGSFGGWVGELRIYNRVLSSDDLDLLYSTLQAKWATA